MMIVGVLGCANPAAQPATRHRDPDPLPAQVAPAPHIAPAPQVAPAPRVTPAPQVTPAPEAPPDPVAPNCQAARASAAASQREQVRLLATQDLVVIPATRLPTGLEQAIGGRAPSQEQLDREQLAIKQLLGKHTGDHVTYLFRPNSTERARSKTRLAEEVTYEGLFVEAHANWLLAQRKDTVSIVVPRTIRRIRCQSDAPPATQAVRACSSHPYNFVVEIPTGTKAGAKITLDFERVIVEEVGTGAVGQAACPA